MGRRTIIWLFAGALSTLLMAGCGTDDEQQPTGSEGETEQGTEAEQDTETEEGTQTEQGMENDDGTAADPTELTTAESDVGTILVDGAGITLYLFTQDSPGTSVCTEECLANWPALEGEPTAGDGVEEDLLGSIERDDGTVQATYADWPLYYFVQDSEPGDLNGQGVEDVWYVLAPDGQMITEEADSGPGY